MIKNLGWFKSASSASDRFFKYRNGVYDVITGNKEYAVRRSGSLKLQMLNVNEVEYPTQVYLADTNEN